MINQEVTIVLMNVYMCKDYIVFAHNKEVLK
jgi:hypothetical protein